MDKIPGSAAKLAMRIAELKAVGVSPEDDMTVIFCVKDAVPDTLIQYTLGAGGVEALLLAGIKISKVRAGDKVKEGDE